MSKEDNPFPLFDNVGPSLRQAREKYFSNLREGATCPCCDRYGKIYKRKLNSSMARSLIAFYVRDRAQPRKWVHALRLLQPLLPGSGDYAKLSKWDLLEEKYGDKDDGNPDNGYYRITGKGRQFVEGKIGLPKHIYIYNDQKVQVDGVDELTNIRKALGDAFNYDELMAS